MLLSFSLSIKMSENVKQILEQEIYFPYFFLHRDEKKKIRQRQKEKLFNLSNYFYVQRT